VLQTNPGICIAEYNFATLPPASPCTAALFRIIGAAKTRENHARCHRLAATCLKFAARLGAAPELSRD
jgi:hypothetical protein